MTRPTPSAVWTLGRVATVLPVALGLFSGYAQRAYDSNIHMFFADHYVRGWFDLWEPRWYGGFSVTSYPPLAHQAVALLSGAVGLEPAYVLVTAAAMLALPFAVRSAARAFTEEPSAELALLVAALWPTAHRFAYVFGQLPMLCATPLALFAMGQLNRYLQTGRLRSLGAFLGLLGASCGAHHLTTVFAAGGALLVGLKHLAQAGRSREAWTRLLARGGLSAMGAALTVYGVIWPFWRSAAGEPQTEIPHASRLSLFERGFSLDMAEQLVGLALAVFLCILAAKKRNGSLVLLSAGALLLGVLSLGGTTPLPRLIFRSQWSWLTYDKFHYWSTLLLAIGLGWALTQLKWNGRRTLTVLCATLLPASLFFVGYRSSDAFQPDFIDDLQPMAALLNGPGAEHYRHLTLGFGDQFCRLDVRVASPNVDGDYHTARRDPVLRKSGIATLDAAKYYAAGMTTLANVLGRARTLSLRWVLSADQAYEPALFDAGFDLKEIWTNGVILFERTDVDALPPVAPELHSPVAYAWGVLPMLFLVLGVGLAVWGARTAS